MPTILRSIICVSALALCVAPLMTGCDLIGGSDTGITDTGDTGGTDSEDTDASVADIAVLVDGEAVTSAGIDFSGVGFSADAATKTVTIQNNGDADLSGTATLSATGSNVGEFALDGAQSFTISVAAGASVTVTVSFNPSKTAAYGNGVSRSETVTVASNDPDTASLSFPVTGVGVKPDIGLSYNNTSTDIEIESGVTEVDFGVQVEISFEGQTTRILTISNTGYSVLSGTITLSSGGSNSGEFTVNDGQTCTFSVEAGGEVEIELGCELTYSSTYNFVTRRETVTVSANDEDASVTTFFVSGYLEAS